MNTNLTTVTSPRGHAAPNFPHCTPDNCHERTPQILRQRRRPHRPGALRHGTLSTPLLGGRPQFHEARATYRTQEEAARNKNKEPKEQGDINARLSRLPLIEEVIQHPHEIWERVNENGLVCHTYLAKVLEAGQEKGQGFMVAFTKTGDTATLETYYINKRVTSSKRSGKRIWPKR